MGSSRWEVQLEAVNADSVTMKVTTDHCDAGKPPETEWFALSQLRR